MSKYSSRYKNFFLSRDVCSWSINNNAYLFNFIYKKNNER